MKDKSDIQRAIEDIENLVAELKAELAQLQRLLVILKMREERNA